MRSGLSPRGGVGVLVGKLVRIELATDKVAQVIHFGEDVALQGSYLNDVRFHPNGATAFITDSGARGAIVVASAVLILAVMFLTDSINAVRPAANLAPLFIGLTVGVLVMTAGPLTMASLNPARDLGPRFFAFLAGWDSMAIPGPRRLESTHGPLGS
jgi:glycerol uptake facilitator-like aquaporin